MLSTLSDVRAKLEVSVALTTESYAAEPTSTPCSGQRWQREGDACREAPL
eukprot:m.92539 g.92539  ORF g.92539 m.92539 type:complete len:50 (+) comp12051_c0_seq4:1601-1750(+)